MSFSQYHWRHVRWHCGLGRSSTKGTHSNSLAACKQFPTIHFINFATFILDKCGERVFNLLPHLSWSALWIPCNLLPLQCVNFGKHLCYMSFQKLACSCRNVRLTLVANIELLLMHHFQNTQQFSEMTSHSLEESQCLPFLNGTNWTKVAYVHCHGKLLVGIGSFH